MFFHFYFSHGEDRERALAMYFTSGEVIWETVRQLLDWRFHSTGNVRRVLDFAAGYGRVARHAIADLGPTKVWVSDIYEDSVRFLQGEFGVQGFISSMQPEAVESPHRFDVIFVSSLFTHLPESSFTKWLQRLGGFLEPHGLLIFSVHDEAIMPPGIAMSDEGIVFVEKSESGTLNAQDYGSSWVTEAFVRRAIARSIPGASVLRLRRGLANYQDCYAVSKAALDFSTFAPLRRIDGFVERCEALPRGVRLAGWVADRLTQQSVREVQVRLEKQILSRCTDFAQRDDVAAAYAADQAVGCGWECIVEGEGVETLLADFEIVVMTADGDTRLLSRGTLHEYLLRSRLDDYVLRKRQAEQVIADLQTDLDAVSSAKRQSEATAAGLRDKIAWMELSRFWKIRNAWFRVKAALRS